MRKILKWTGLLGVSIFLIAILATYLLNTFYSPSQFKEKIAHKIWLRTGRTLTFNGDMSWTLLPHPGIRIQHILLSNPKTYKEPLQGEIDDLEVGIKVLPLLYGKIKVNNIRINNVRLDLGKNKNGDVNWQIKDLEKEDQLRKARIAAKAAAAEAARKAALMPAASKTKPVAKKVTVATKPVTKPTVKQAAPIKPASPPDIISNITIKNVAITYSDEQKDKLYRLKNTYLSANNIQLGNNFPVIAQLDFYPQKNAGAIHLNVTLNLNINTKQKKYAVNDIALHVNNKRKGLRMDSGLNGNIVLDLKQQTLRLNNIKAAIANLPFTANIQVTHLRKKPAINGKIQINAFNFKDWTNRVGENFENLRKTGNLTSTITLINNAGSNQVNIDAQLQSALFNATKLSKIHLQANYQNNIVSLDSFTADLLQGKLESHAKVDLSTSLPTVTAQLIAKKIQIKSVRLPFTKDLQASGLTNLNLQVKTFGKKRDTLLNNLNGKVTFDITNGSLIGNMASLSTTNTTKFKKLSATINIKNGVIQNDDLHLDAPRLQISGNGQANLSKNRIHYEIHSSTPANLAVTGNLKHPSIVMS